MNLGNEIIIDIDEQDKQYAHLWSKLIPDNEGRTKAYTNALAADLGLKFLACNGIEVYNSHNLHTVKRLLEEFSFADVMLPNIHIDFRLVFNENYIFIPKSHFDNDILPDIYVVFKQAQDNEEVSLIGFFEPRLVNKNNANDEYYFFEKEKLSSPSDFLTFIKNFDGNTNVAFDSETREHAEMLMISMADYNISQQDKKNLLKVLVQSDELREKFMEFENFDLLSRQAVKKAEMPEVQTQTDDKASDESESNVSFEDFSEFNPLEMTETVADSVLDTAEEVSDTHELLEHLYNEYPDDFHEYDDTEALQEDADSEVSADVVEENSQEFEENAVDTYGEDIHSEFLAETIEQPAEEYSETPKELSEESFEENINEDFNNASEDFDEFLSETVEENIELSEDIEPVQTADEFLNLEEPEISEEAEDLTLQEETKEEFTEAFESAETFASEFLEQTDTDVAEQSEGLSELSFEEALPELPQDEAGFDLQEISANITEEVPEVQNETVEVTEEDNTDIVETDCPSEFCNDGLPDDGEAESFDTGLDAIIEELPKQEIQTGAFEPDKSVSGTLEEPQVSVMEELEQTLNEDIDLSQLEKIDIEPLEISEQPAISEPALMSFDEIQSDKEEKVIEHDGEGFEFSLETEEIHGSAHEEPLRAVEETPVAEEVLSGFDLSDINDLPEVPEYQSEDISSVLSEIEDAKPSNDLKTEQYSETGEQEVFQPELHEEKLEVLFNEKELGEDGMKKLKALQEEEINEPDATRFLKLAGTQNKKNIFLIVLFVTIVSCLVIYATIFRTKSTPAPQETILPENQSVQDIPNPIEPVDVAQNTPALEPISKEEIQSAKKEMQQNKNLPSKQQTSAGDYLTVSKISWEVPYYLSASEAFRAYLQTAGKSIKLSLSSDLLLTSDYAYSNQVKVNVDLSKDGSVNLATIVTSSGSEQIDKIVLQTVKDTLNVLKAPSAEVQGKNFHLVVIINF